MAKKVAVNLIPRPVEELPAQGANLWALACGLKEMSKRDHAPDHFSMASYLSQEPLGSGCRTVRCALGYAPMLGIAITDTQINHEWIGPMFGYYNYGARVLIGNTANRSHVWLWCFGAQWAYEEGRDDTLLGAAERIGFLVCHYDHILEHPARCEDTDRNKVSRLRKGLYRENSLFTRWRQQIDWNVTPEIPGAEEVVDRVVERARMIEIDA